MVVTEDEKEKIVKLGFDVTDSHVWLLFGITVDDEVGLWFGEFDVEFWIITLVEGFFEVVAKEEALCFDDSSDIFLIESLVDLRAGVEEWVKVMGFKFESILQ